MTKLRTDFMSLNPQIHADWLTPRLSGGVSPIKHRLSFIFLRYSVAAVCRTSVGLLAVFPPRRKSFEIWRATPGASLCEKRRHVLPRPDWLRARAPSAGAGAARPEEEARRKCHSWASHFTQAQQAKLLHSEQ